MCLFLSKAHRKSLTFAVIHVEEGNVNYSWFALFLKDIVGPWLIRVQFRKVHFGEGMACGGCILSGPLQSLNMRHNSTQ